MVRTSFRVRQRPRTSRRGRARTELIVSKRGWAPALRVLYGLSLLAVRRIYGLAGGIGAVDGVQRSFVGSPPLREGLRFLRMIIWGGVRTVRWNAGSAK